MALRYRLIFNWKNNRSFFVCKVNLSEKLRVSVGTTNCIESLNSLIERFANNVKNWKTLEHIFRLFADVLMEGKWRIKRSVTIKDKII